MNLQITVAQMGAMTGYAIFNIYDPTALNTVIDSQNVALPISGTAIINFANVQDQTYIIKTYISPDTNWQHGTQMGDDFYAYPNNSNIYNLRDDLVLTADSTTGFASGQNAYVDNSLVGWNYSVEQKGTGTLIIGWEIAIDADGGWHFINGYVIQSGEIYIIHFQPQMNTGVPITTSANAKGSLFNGYEVITTDTTLSASDMGKTILLQGANPLLQITLPDPTTIPDGQITAFLTPGAVNGSMIMASIISTTQFNWLNKSLTAIHMGICEELWIFKIGTTWYMAHSEGNFKTVGQLVDAYVLDDLNVFQADGQTFLRTNYPRITDFILNRLDSSMLISDTDWNLYTDITSTSGTAKRIYPNHGKWSLGDGSTTLRKPLLFKKKDSNGNFIDNGFLRAVDGVTEKAGAYNPDMVGNFFAKISGIPTVMVRDWIDETMRYLVLAAAGNIHLAGSPLTSNDMAIQGEGYDGTNYNINGETAPGAINVYRLIRY